MASVKEFNDTLFELTDEMLGIINPSPVMTTAYSVFKNMYATNPDSQMALDAFWEVAKDSKELISRKDVKAMKDVLLGVVPMPGMVDDVWNALSEENREIVGDYVSVLYEQASKLKAAGLATPDANENDAPKEENQGTMYSMYNSIWNDFLLLLQSCCSSDDDFGNAIKEAVEKLGQVISSKGPANTMVYGVLYPSLETVLPSDGIAKETDILALCLPPRNASAALKSDRDKLASVLFPFNRKVPFSDLLDAVLRATDNETREKLATYWHYIKLFTLCVHECPPEVLGMMNQMIAFFQQGQGLGALPFDPSAFFLRDDPTVLTK